MLGILFASMICKLMLAHLSRQSYRILRTSLLPLIAATLNSVGAPLYSRLTGAPYSDKPLLDVPEDQALHVVLALACASWYRALHSTPLHSVSFSPTTLTAVSCLCAVCCV